MLYKYIIHFSVCQPLFENFYKKTDAEASVFFIILLFSLVKSCKQELEHCEDHTKTCGNDQTEVVLGMVDEQEGHVGLCVYNERKDGSDATNCQEGSDKGSDENASNAYDEYANHCKNQRTAHCEESLSRKIPDHAGEQSVCKCEEYVCKLLEAKEEEQQCKNATTDVDEPFGKLCHALLQKQETKERTTYRVADCSKSNSGYKLDEAVAKYTNRQSKQCGNDEKPDITEVYLSCKLTDRMNRVPNGILEVADEFDVCKNLQFHKHLPLQLIKYDTLIIQPEFVFVNRYL